MMKSFWCRPPILCVHQVTVTLPHSVKSAGWCPSSSACSPTLLVNASAWAKLPNVNTRSRRLMPSRCTTCHSGTCGRRPAISASVSVGSSPRQAVHFISDSSLMVSSFLWACRLRAKSILRMNALGASQQSKNEKSDSAPQSPQQSLSGSGRSLQQFEDMTLMGLYGRTQDLVVTGEGFGHRLGVSLPERGGALHVGEQKGERAGVRFCHPLCISPLYFT